MKSLERMVLNHVLKEVQYKLDPLQFAYRKERSTEDALLFMLHNIYCYLDRPKGYVCVLSADLSSAFTTIRPHIMTESLLQFGVESFFTDRVQCVRVNEAVSSPIITNTGAPQGTISLLINPLYK